MPCDSCGCVCSAGGETPREDLESPQLLDVQTGLGDITAAPEAKKERTAAAFIFRGLLVILWVYLFYSMRKYAIKYKEGDTWFSLFAAIVMALPMTEFFLIIGS